MKKCLRCQAEMIENLDIKVSGAGYGIVVADDSIFGKRYGKIKCSVCPECGYLESHIDKTDKIKKLKDKQQGVLN